MYSRLPGHRNWQIETAAKNLAGFLHYSLETCWQQFGQFLNDFLGPSTQCYLFPIPICFFLIPKEIAFRKTI